MKKSFVLVSLLLLGLITLSYAETQKKLVMVAGKRSHRHTHHEMNAGILLLSKCLENYKQLQVETHLDGWPEDESVFAGADAILIYMDGGENHPVFQDERWKIIDREIQKGAGLAMFHYALDPPDEASETILLRWMGGIFQDEYTQNPKWEPNFTEIPNHPITQGIEPFSIRDEWYFNLRFVDEMKHISAILESVPPKDILPEGMKPEKEIQAWAYQRPDGGRSFGFSGGHFHLNWGNENYRKVVLNALLWISKIEVPETGVKSVVVEDDLMQNLDNDRMLEMMEN